MSRALISFAVRCPYGHLAEQHVDPSQLEPQAILLFHCAQCQSSWHPGLAVLTNIRRRFPELLALGPDQTIDRPLARRRRRPASQRSQTTPSPATSRKRS